MDKIHNESWLRQVIFHMQISEYKFLEERERMYFWNVGRREILREALRRNLSVSNADILDVGCGTGGNMLLLRDFGSVTGVDFSAEALKFAENSGFKSLMLGDATRLNMVDASFDLVTALDVLEHVPDDAAAIGEAWRVLRPGGIFLVTAPSYPWLWSQHDEVLHHVRRYNKKDLLGKLRKVGFVVSESSHFVMLAVVINLARKFKDKLFGVVGKAPHGYDIVFSGPINLVLLFLMRCEKFLMRRISLPFGTSIMVVARKAEAAAEARKVESGIGEISSKADLAKCGFAKFVEWVSCDICGSDDFRVIYPSRYEVWHFSGDLGKSFAYASADRARGNIVRCRNCSLAYMTPRDKNVYTLYEGVEDDYYFSSRDDRTVSFERDLQELHKTLGVSDGGGKKLLDIGCSYGFFMDVAKGYGWDVYGSELSKKQFEFASRSHSNICNKQIRECGFPDNFFDVVTLYDVLEHVTSPSDFLRDIHCVLKPGGMLAITTPDLASPSARLMGKFWINFARMHLYYFTPETVAKLLGKTGFTMIKYVRHKRVAKLGVIVRWMSKYPLLYWIVNFLLNNRFIKDIRFSSSLSGNMTVYAKKL